MRWRVPIAVAVGLLLIWGAVGLQRIFHAERDQAITALASEEKALARYALVDLERTLQRRLRAARPRIEAATRDPLADDVNFLLIVDHRQRLPRPVAFAETPGTPVADLLARLRADARAVAAEGPWAARIELLVELEEAVAADDKEAITRIVRALLNHRSRYLLPVTQEAPYMLRFLRVLVDGTTPDPALLRALLRDGLRGGRGQRVEGLQALLLAKRDRLNAADFEALKGEVITLADAAQVDRADFARQAERSPAPSVAIELPLAAPGLAAGYYVEPYEESGARGVRVDIDEAIARVGEQMRSGGLLGAEDELRRVGALEAIHPLTGLTVEVDSPARSERHAAIERRYRLKTALAVALVALAGAVVALVFVLYRREQRFLQSKADFVATVSHELRTPLASMRVMAETLERRLADHPEARDFPARLVGDVDRLSFLVDNILSFNRLDKGGFAPRPTAVNLTELAATLRRDAAAFTRKPVELLVGADRTFEADRDLMKLLFSNLVANACKYTERDTVRIELAAGVSRVTVRDNGVGIAPAQWERVFVEFVREGGGSGFGLGLAICRRIMELHGGSIRILASGEEGTTFELSFPEVA